MTRSNNNFDVYRIRFVSVFIPRLPALASPSSYYRDREVEFCVCVIIVAATRQYIDVCVSNLPGGTDDENADN